ncbi:MAG: RNA 2',3'-cyclic phosphodiesterase [Candidatus Acidiferrum sp.]
MRLFIAIEIPGAIRNALATFLKELREIAPQVKWVRAENLHVTLKFLGETDGKKLGEIETTLRAIRSSQPITMEFLGLGFFPNEKRPRVFWTGMDSSANLSQLAGAIDHGLHQCGFPLEDRPFLPHLTLARFNPPGLPPKLVAAAKEHGLRSFGSLTAREFHLIESRLKSTGAEYTTVQSFPFVTET